MVNEKKWDYFCKCLIHWKTKKFNAFSLLSIQNIENTTWASGIFVDGNAHIGNLKALLQIDVLNIL